MSHAIALPGHKQSEQVTIDNLHTHPLIYQESFDVFLKRFNDNSVDLLLTNPPYSTEIESIESFVKGWLPMALDRVKATGRAYVCIGAYPEELRTYLNVAHSYCQNSHLELSNILVWTYKNTIGPKPTRGYRLNWQAILYFVGCEAQELNCELLTEQSSVHEINAPDGRQGNRYFKWQKPDELAGTFVRHGSDSGGLVVDPFAYNHRNDVQPMFFHFFSASVW